MDSIRNLPEEQPVLRNYSEELAKIIRSGISPRALKDRLSDYHQRDIAEVLEELTPAERVSAGSPRTGRCADVRGCCGNSQRRRSKPAGSFRQKTEPQAAKQPAMDLSRDKNAEEMKWSPLEMGAAKQAHGA